MNKQLAAGRLALLAYCGLIFYLSSRSDYPEVTWFPKELPDPHYIAHLVIYMGLGFFAWNVFSREKSSFISKNAVVAVIVFCAVYGLSDEIHQLFVPGRQFQLTDLLMDTAGAAVAATFMSRVGKGKDASETAGRDT